MRASLPYGSEFVIRVRVLVQVQVDEYCCVFGCFGESIGNESMCVTDMCMCYGVSSPTLT